ncbi:MAG: thioredoxin [Oscillospiraceae bacterium]|nr:thioredoxin [Oscillospiraceae bacterium]
MYVQGIPGADRGSGLRGLLPLHALLQGKIDHQRKERYATMAEIKLTESNFQAEALRSDKPVLIDFWASWCGPCKMLAPIISEIADEHPEWKVCKVNVDEEGALAVQYGIASIPTVLLVKNGEVIAKSVGYAPKEELLGELGL